MKAAAFLFFAIASYLLGAIATAVAAPYLAAQSAINTASPDLAFALIPGLQATGGLLFLVLAVAQLLAEIIKNEAKTRAD
jgi:hypothetical protein